MRPRATACLACLGLCTVLLSGCPWDGPPDLGESREFDAFAVYYAGDEVDGLPLTRAEGTAFAYGECDPPAGEGGCSPPIAIQNQSICDRWPAALVRGEGWRLRDFRGAKATGGGRGGTPLEIFTGRTTVVIFGDGQGGAWSAARLLRDVDADRRSAALPPPAPETLTGSHSCQRRGR